MKEKVKGILGYNYENDRYGILNNLDLWENEGLHCGACLEVLVDDKWIETSIEKYRGEWYLVGTNLKGDDLEYLKVRM